jgi:hypothetical protein
VEARSCQRDPERPSRRSDDTSEQLYHVDDLLQASKAQQVQMAQMLRSYRSYRTPAQCKTRCPSAGHRPSAGRQAVPARQSRTHYDGAPALNGPRGQTSFGLLAGVQGVTEISARNHANAAPCGSLIAPCGHLIDPCESEQREAFELTLSTAPSGRTGFPADSPG